MSKKKEENISELIKISDVDRTVSVQDYFANLDVGMDDYDDFEIPRELANRYKRHIMGLRTGTHAVVPLNCPGYGKCPIVSRCPFAMWNADGSLDRSKSKFPLLKSCPIERHVMTYRIQGYIEDLDVSPNSAGALALVTKLAELDIYEMRVDIQLSCGDRNEEGMNLLQEAVDAIDPQNGRAYVTYKIHPLWEIKSQIGRQRLDLMNALLATPKARLQAAKMLGAKTKIESNIVQEMTDLRSALDELENDSDVIDADWEDANS